MRLSTSAECLTHSLGYVAVVLFKLGVPQSWECLGAAGLVRPPSPVPYPRPDSHMSGSPTMVACGVHGPSPIPTLVVKLLFLSTWQ